MVFAFLKYSMYLYLPLYYLLLHFYFGVVVTQTILSIVHNQANDCEVGGDKNLATCPRKAWLATVNQNLHHFFDGVGGNVDECLGQCLIMESCVAIVFQAHANWCGFFKPNYTKSYHGYIQFKTFELICCGWRDPFNSISHTFLPMVFKPDINCVPQSSKDTRVCQYKAFHQIERKQNNNWNIFSKRLYGLDCQSECMKHSGCHAYQVEMNVMLVPTCKFYSNGDVMGHDKPSYNVFNKICCKYNHHKLWTGQKKNLMMLYQPSSVCNATSSLGVLKTNCPMQYWLVEEETRISGDFFLLQTNTLTLIENLLNECSGYYSCYSVTIDWHYSKAYFFNANGIRIKKYAHWTTYTLQCCHGFI